MLARSRLGMWRLGRRRTVGPSWWSVAASAFALGDVLASLAAASAFEVEVETAVAAAAAAAAVVPRSVVSEVVFGWIAATEHGVIVVARIGRGAAVGVALGVVAGLEVVPRVEFEQGLVERVQSAGAAAADGNTSSSGCPVLDMVARTPSGAAVAAPVALAATEFVPAEVEAEVGPAPVAVQQHMMNYVPG
jgi:hypothetical protein